MEMGIDKVDVIVRTYDNKMDILEAIVLENKVRDKTNLQKSNEAETLYEVERERAKERQLSTQFTVKNKDAAVVAELPTPLKQGRTRDIVAEQVGFKSGREVERAVRVAKEIKQAEAEGDTDKAEILKGQLERSPAVAEAHNIYVRSKSLWIIA